MQLHISLAKGGGIAMALVIATAFTTSPASAASCRTVDRQWVPAFNDSVYDCDANAPAPDTGPAPECDLLVSALACCDQGSKTKEEKACTCPIYTSNVTIFNGIGITDKKCK